MEIQTLLKHGAKEQTPKRVIIHAMGEYIETADARQHAAPFLDSIGLSAHALVAPDGTNYRCRLDTQGAYHAAGHNTDTLGLEFLVPGIHTYASLIKTMAKPYLSVVQYEAGLEQVRSWRDRWNITEVLRHSDISPERKVDPGLGFPWIKFLSDLGL